MDYAVKYWAQHKDDNNSITYKIEILEDGFGGSSSEIVNLGLDPVNISHRGSKDDKDAIIQGSELIFNFWHYKESNVYDTLFESDYKDYKVIYYKSTTKIWEGYIKPENLTRQFIGDKYQISLSATDALADLKEIEYPGTDEVVSILEAIKKCTDEIGISLDFKVQLNTYESSLMSYNDCALFDVDINEKRFIKYEDGRAYNDTCYNVLAEVLKPFNVTLKQDEGYYKITNYNEPNSYVYTFTYSTLAQASRSSNNLEIDLTNYDFLSKGEMNKIEPLKAVNCTFQNRNLGENIVSNGDFSNGLTGWNNGTSPYNIYSLSVSNEILKASEPDALGDSNTDKYFQTDIIAVTKYGDNDYLKFTFKAKLHSVSFTSGNINDNPLYLQIQCVCPDSSVVSTGNLIIQQDWATYTNSFPISSTGNYRLRILIHPHSGATYSAWEVHFDDVEGLTIYESADITFDKFIKGINTPSTAINSDERKVFFGDSNQNNDVGCLKVGTTRTSSWNRYNKTDQLELLKLYLQNILNNNASYRNYLRLSIRDENDSINYNDVIKIRTKYYVFTFFQKSYKRNAIDCELIELLTTDVTVSYTSQYLTSVDGESSGSSSTQVSSSGGVTDHGELTGLSDDDHTQYFNQSRGDVRYLRKDQADSTSYALTVGSLKMGSWEIKLNGTVLEFHYSGAMKASLSTAGYLKTKDEQEAFV